MNPLDLVKLTPLMGLNRGAREIVVGLIDGPVAVDLPALANASIRTIPGKLSGLCSLANSAACKHGTLVAGILSANRESSAPAICPDCTLLVRSIFAETSSDGQMPSATPDELAAAIVETVDAGARVINLSAALAQPSSQSKEVLKAALDYAMRRGVIIIAAAGNQGTLGSSTITRHPWVIPVVACDLTGKPMGGSNLGSSIGRRGLRAPGDGITSLGTQGKPLTFGGTSAAAPFVTGAVALLWSEFSDTTAADIKLALTRVDATRRTTVVPPVMDAWKARQILAHRR